MGNLNFNAADVPPATAFDPLPPGWYSMRIIGAEITVSEKAGEMLKIEHEIDEHAHPEYANRKAFNNLCINHPNDKPREIARRTLSAIAHAIGKLQIADSVDLLGATLRVRLKAVPAKDGYDARNEVAGYKSLSEDVPATAAASQADALDIAAPAKPAARPSWKK